MQNKVFFSVITVVKNRESKILNTLNSVKFQTYKNFEHIVVDGFSTDKTGKIIKNNMHKKMNFFQYQDLNLYDAINFAINKSKGEYILFLHAGDIFFSHDILKNINLMIKEDTDIVLGGCVYFNKEFKISRIWKIKDNQINASNCYKVPHTGTVMSKKIINKIGAYNIKYNISSDTDYLIRLFSKKNNVEVFEEFICFMEMGGLSTNYDNLLKKFIQDIQIYFIHFHFLLVFNYLKKIFSKLIHFKDENKLNYQIKLNNMIKEINN